MARNVVNTDTITYSAEHVWAAASAAQRVNGGYFKEPLTNDAREIVKPANRVLVRDFLNGTREILEEDHETGRRARGHFEGLPFMYPSLSEYQKAALRLTTQNTFTNRDFMAVGLMCSLINSYLRDEEIWEVRAKATDLPLGRVGDRITGEVRVIGSNYSERYYTYFNSGVVKDKLVTFSSRTRLQAGCTYQFRGTIKMVQADGTVQLNRMMFMST